MLNSKNKKAFSIIEVVVYVGILSILTISIVGGMIQFNGFFIKVRNERKVALAAETALEAMLREARLAGDVLGFPCGSSQCVEFDSRSSYDFSTATQVHKRFMLNGNKISFYPDYVNSPATTYDITPADVTINNFSVTYLPRSVFGKLSVSKAVRIEFSASTGLGKNAVNHYYYATAILRGSY